MFLSCPNLQECFASKSLYRCCAGRHFYGAENEIWAGFGPPVSNTEKKIGADYEQLLRVIFSSFQGQKNNFFFFKYCSTCTKKLHKMKVRNQKRFFKI